MASPALRTPKPSTAVHRKTTPTGAPVAPPAPPVDQQATASIDCVRTTVVLPPEVYWNMSAWCVQHQLRKGDAIVELLSLGLRQKGIDPTRMPNLKLL